MQDIAHRVKKVRELKNLSQEFVAKKMGMSQGNYARLENGGIRISGERLKQISQVLNTSESSIIHFDENLLYSMKNEKFEPNPKAIAQFFDGLSELFEDEIQILERKLQLLRKLKQ
jgi:transcriptional regulator with XRE-family HTH domain